MHENEIAKQILDVAFRVHSKLGPGLFESVYENIMAYELRKLGFEVEQQKALPLVYEEIKMDTGFRIDLLINSKVIIEIKSVEEIAPVHKKQLLTYLKLSEKKLGLLINFNVAHLREGIVRVVNGL